MSTQMSTLWMVTQTVLGVTFEAPVAQWFTVDCQALLRALGNYLSSRQLA